MALDTADIVSDAMFRQRCELISASADNDSEFWFLCVGVADESVRGIRCANLVDADDLATVIEEASVEALSMRVLGLLVSPSRQPSPCF